MPSVFKRQLNFTVDEGKGRLNPSRDKRLRQAAQKKSGAKYYKPRCVNLFMCDPGRYVKHTPKGVDRPDYVDGTKA